MLTTLRITGFQCHADRTVRLAPVTTLVGPNDRGKSAVVRALRWLALNQPAGTEFVGAWGKAPVTQVAGCFDGHWITRRRSKSDNLYRIDGGSPHLQVGQGGVPEEVRALHRLSDENFQLQLDPPFWFMESAPEVSRELNRIVNLELIDAVVGTAASDVRRLKASVEAARGRVADAEARSEALEWADAAREKWEDVEGKERDAASAAETASSLRSLVEPMKRLAQTRKVLGEAKKRASSVLAHARDAEDAREKREALEHLIGQVRAAEETASLPAPDIGLLSALRRDADLAAEHRRSLEALVESARAAKENVCRLQKTLESARSRMKRSSRGRCPACGRPLASGPQTPSRSGSESPTCTSHSVPPPPAPWS